MIFFHNSAPPPSHPPWLTTKEIVTPAQSNMQWGEGEGALKICAHYNKFYRGFISPTSRRKPMIGNQSISIGDNGYRLVPANRQSLIASIVINCYPLLSIDKRSLGEHE